MTDTMLGEWRLVSSENFEEVMKALGVGFMTRKIGANLKPNVKLEKNGDEWTFTTSSSFKTTVIKFKLNQEFDEETIDGRKVKSTITLDGDKLVQTQKDADGKLVCTITREITPKGELKAVVAVGDVSSTRVYEKI